MSAGVYPDGAVVQRTASLSPDEVYRFTLRRCWSDCPTEELTYVMLNPSTADAAEDDHTIRKCVGFARRLGYNAINVVNLYAFRTRYPEELKAAGYPTGGDRNDDLLREIGRHMEHGMPVVAAWGVHPQAERVAEVLSWRGWDRLTSLGVTKDRAPRHPLMLGYTDVGLKPWPEVVA